MNIRQEKHLMRHVEKDEIYQEILSIRNSYEPNFKRILLMLSPEDQHSLRMYVRSCEAVKERMIRTSYFLSPYKEK